METAADRDGQRSVATRYRLLAGRCAALIVEALRAQDGHFPGWRSDMTASSVRVLACSFSMIRLT